HVERFARVQFAVKVFEQGEDAGERQAHIVNERVDETVLQARQLAFGLHIQTHMRRGRLRNVRLHIFFDDPSILRVKLTGERGQSDDAGAKRPAWSPASV